LVFGSDLQQMVLPSLTVMLSLSFIFGNRCVQRTPRLNARLLEH
jgi:hypothetical protein